MEVILLQDVEKLGKEHELVKVRPGFGNNFLIPRGLAVVASESAKKDIAEMEKQATRREEKLMKEIVKVVDVLKESVFRVGAKTGTSGKIFGSVTTLQLSQAIKKEKGFTIDRKKISFPEEPKNLGTYTAEIRLHADVTVPVTFEVVAE